MKFFILCFVICTTSILSTQAAMTEEIKTHLDGYRKICIDETSVKPELIKKAQSGDITDDKNLKTYLLCLGKKLGFFNTDGEVQPDVIIRKLGEVVGDIPLVTKIVEECTVIKPTPLETVLAGTKCVYNKLPASSKLF